MVDEIHYRVPWRAHGHRPGHHAGVQSGPGFEFKGHASLLAAPDPRRLDIRASLGNPFGDWLVRVFQQRAALPVCLIADLSGSMGFAGRRRKLDVLADLTASIGYSAWRTGDPFAFIGCDHRVREDFFLPPTRLRGAGIDLAARLRALAPGRSDAAGLLEAPKVLGRQRGLVLLVSDFHFPLDWARRLRDTLSHHDLAPLVIWDPTEYRHLPRFGLATLRDPETGKPRTLLLRTKLRRRIEAAFEERREALREIFSSSGREPLFLEHGFRADRLTGYFLRGWTAEAGSHAE